MLMIETKLADVTLLQNVSVEVLEDSDVFSIIRTLYFEGQIDIMNGEDGDVYRPAMLPIPESSPLTSVPCGVCPVSLSHIILRKIAPSSLAA